MAVLEITTDNFEQEVLNSDVPVLVDFWQPGAVPVRCRARLSNRQRKNFPE